MRKFKTIVSILLSIMFLMSCGTKEEQNDMTEQEEYTSENIAISESFSEESTEEETEDYNSVLLDKFEYSYDESNYITVCVIKDEELGTISVSAFGHYSEDNVGLMQDDFMWISMYPLAKSIDVSFTGEGGYMYLMNDGKLTLNTMPLNNIEKVAEEYTEQIIEMHDELTAFYAQYGIADKTYNTLVYEDENVKISFTGISENGVNFNVENTSSGTVTIQARAIAINGQSTSSIIMSDDVAAMSSGTVIAQCDDFNGIDEIETITGELRIISDNWQTYSANFVNIEIE